MDKFVAGKAPAHLRTDQFEGSCQVESRFVVVVLQLMQDLFVVVCRLAAHQRDTVVAEFGLNLKLVQKVLRPRQRLVIGVQRRVDCSRARIDALGNVHQQIFLLGRLVFLRRRVLIGGSGSVGIADFDASIGEKMDATTQRFVAVVRARESGDSYNRQWSGLDDDGTLNDGDLEGPARRADNVCVEAKWTAARCRKVPQIGVGNFAQKHFQVGFVFAFQRQFSQI